MSSIPAAWRTPSGAGEPVQSPNRQSPERPPKIARIVRPRNTRSDSRVVSSLSESCEVPLQKTDRTPNQSTDTTSITTAIARKTKVKITQASVAQSKKSHRRFMPHIITRVGSFEKRPNPSMLVFGFVFSDFDSRLNQLHCESRLNSAPRIHKPVHPSRIIQNNMIHAAIGKCQDESTSPIPAGSHGNFCQAIISQLIFVPSPQPRIFMFFK